MLMIVLMMKLIMKPGTAKWPDASIFTSDRKKLIVAPMQMFIIIPNFFTGVLGTILTHGDHHSNVELYTHMTLVVIVLKTYLKLYSPKKPHFTKHKR